MFLSTCILPIATGPAETKAAWQRAEILGFHAAYTYDHLNWEESFRDGPWGDAWLTLATAAAVTSTIRLGTLVSTPNFHHPVTLAKKVVTLDGLSGGRVTLGLGAGTDEGDARILGAPTLTPRRRADRFAELVEDLGLLLTQDVSTFEGEWYAAVEARMLPRCVQRPRVPFAIAGGGPRGMRLAATYGQAWVTVGDDAIGRGGTVAETRAAIAEQVARLDAACAEVSRDPATLSKILLTGFTADDVHSAADAFLEAATAYARLGITEIVLHAPIPDTRFEMDERVYEEVAALVPELAAL